MTSIDSSRAMTSNQNQCQLRFKVLVALTTYVVGEFRLLAMSESHVNSCEFMPVNSNIAFVTSYGTRTKNYLSSGPVN